MCGIAGVIGGPGGEEQHRSWVSEMTKILAHRGPDAEGFWVDSSIALGHRRLSIIDLTGGHQPMVDPNGHAVVVFNGEIYNFKEIREDLKRKGYSFRTRSDTEVLLYAYLDKGYSCLEDFEGMFAFAIWDTRTRTLFAARDRMGKKPFYYTLQNGSFVFASELSAFRALPFVRLEVSRTSLARFLAYEYVPTPNTIFRDAFKLRPGHFLTYSDGAVRTVPYWDLPVPEPETALSEDECCERLRFLASRATKRRLESDVPLGVFLSGGIDSSSIVALMAEHVSAENIKTFSIGFSEPTYDESPYSRLVARQFGTDHYEEKLSASAAGELLPDIVARFDEPMADPSIVPTYLLSGMTRKKVTVALGGDGGDELFGGYEYFLGFKFAEYYLGLPEIVRRHVVEPILRKLPLSTGYVSPRQAAQRFVVGAEAPQWLRTQIWNGAFTTELQRELWNEFPDDLSSSEEIYAESRRLYESFPSEDPMNRIYYLFAKQYLLDYILVKVDRCSMMHSLEVRAPFLDKDLVEFAFRLPPRMKIRGITRKYLLKKTFKKDLPAIIRNRKKRGFLIPTSLWLKDTLRPLVEEMFSEARLRQQGVFRPEVVRRLVQEHDTGAADHRKELWTLLVLQLWLHFNRASVV